MLEEMIKQYGYLILFLGTVAEGETILIMAGFLSHGGYLKLPWVIVTAFFGTLLGDQLFFYLGYLKGLPILQKHPSWQVKFERVTHWLSNHQLPIILSFRFLYGFRTITPFVIGFSKVAPVRFLLLNATGALLWAIVVALSGYFLGQVLEAHLDRIKRYEMLILAGIAVIGLLIWLYHSARSRASRKGVPMSPSQEKR